MFVDDDIEAPNVTADLQRYDDETVGESSMCGCACQASAVLRRAYHWIPLLFPRCVQAISVGFHDHPQSLHLLHSPRKPDVRAQQTA
jgi:hypothetical protein